ncbi:terminase gpA endonuclease subunit [Phascolarctobacterium sp.]|uniref:phage terminase large subunit family protein n=1 Tax=Phascolarctobacterium sp. TaxID=2049039 RepID=UPI0030784B08
MIQKTIKLFKAIVKTALTPLSRQTVSEWADSYRMLSSEAAAEPGRWRTERAPYQKAIMDAFTEPGINVVVAKTASQIGKSDIMNNVIGRFSHLAPAPMMMLQPTIEMSQDYSKTRIAPMIRDTKVLKDIFKEVKSRETSNTILSKQFPGGRLIMAGANSPAGLASRPIKILLADEVDRFPKSAGTEGDPVSLAAKRMTTFWDRVMGLFSTPTNAGDSRIEDEYVTGTQEEWQHQCPNCDEWHLLTHRDMHTDYDSSIDKKGKKHVIVKAVTWRCPDCGFGFTETEMRQAAQKYIAQNASALAKGVRSFFVNCFASPWVNWSDVMQEWLEAQGDPEREKVVVNTRFGEAYERKGNFESHEQFMRRRENYGAELPEGVLLLTAAVDVQDNRLEYEICGWGMAEECWGIKKGTILGVPDTPKVWDMLDEQLDKEYRFASGKGLLVARTFIDSGGHYTKEVYAYCKKRFARQRFAIKGSSTPGVPLLHKYAKVKTVRGHTIPLVMLGTDSGKQYVMDRLSIEKPGPKYFHYPLDNSDGVTVQLTRGYDKIYFKGLISEVKVPRRKNGVLVYQWVNIAKDKRNEPLDLRVYNLACMLSVNPDFEALEKLINSPAVINEQPSVKAKPKNKPKSGYGCIRKGVRGDY